MKYATKRVKVKWNGMELTSEMEKRNRKFSHN